MVDRILTLRKAAIIAGIRLDTLRSKMRRRNIKSSRINGHAFIKESELLTLIKVKNETI